MRILTVEDGPKTGADLKKGVQESGVADHAREDGEGLILAQQGRCHVIVLAVMLPVHDGWGVLKRLRDTHTTPVLFRNPTARRCGRCACAAASPKVRWRICCS